MSKLTKYTDYNIAAWIIDEACPEYWEENETRESRITALGILNRLRNKNWW